MQDAAHVAYTDFNCPYCYALNERLLAMGDQGRPGWRGIEHFPNVTSAERGPEVQLMLSNEVATVRRRAPEVTIANPGFIPSTGPANRLVAALSRTASAGDLLELRTAIYRAYWRHGDDIEDRDVLARLCREVGLAPVEPDADVDGLLAHWQAEWEGERFHKRLPAMLSRRSDRVLLGFPALDVLYSFFAEAALPVTPESLAACELKPRQHLLFVGPEARSRVNAQEFRTAYVLRYADSVEEARAAEACAVCPPDLVLVDMTQPDGPAFCVELRTDPRYRTVPILALVPPGDPAAELAAFDAGATDVLFDLTHPKVAQARLELHLRLQRSSALLASMARFDFVTELPNRRELDRRLDQEWGRARRAGKPLSACMIDIDHFKKYNDRYGHAAGDDCLRLVAAAIRGCARRSGDLVARYGGEEFSVLFPDTGAEDAQARAGALCEAVRALALPHDASPVAPHVTICVGVATIVPTTEGAGDALLRAADEALYRAKASGRNRWCAAE